MRGVHLAKRRKGFTLIEVIASLAIIALGLIGILSLFPVGIDASKRAGDLTHATELARGVLNQIRSAAKTGDLSLNEAESIFETSTPRDFREDLDNKVIPIVDDLLPSYHKLYQYQIEFDDPPKSEKLDDLNRVGLQKVTVVVSWPAKEREIAFRNRITLVTFIRFPE
ncbi:type II secretion system protein [bacterium]|nr:type II secretion system protein [bacterium]